MFNIENSKSVFAKMNSLGNSRSPFLFAFSYDLSQAFIIPTPLEQTEVLFKTPIASNIPNNCSSGQQLQYFEALPIPFEQYEQSFEIIQNGLQRGDSFLANLTVRTPVRTNLTLDDLFFRATARYKILVPNNFVCFSPESFVSLNLETQRIETRPMKGTIDASLPEAERIILCDEKETAEHYTIVDLMRSDLARIATNVSVEKFRYIDRLTTSKNTLLQVSSLIAGKIITQNLGDIFEALLPAGSISGAPKQATCKLINSAEQEPRGFYSGVFGYFDGKQLDSGVLIRFIAQHNGMMYYHSGGGITINSRAKEEYNEVVAKVYIPQSK